MRKQMMMLAVVAGMGLSAGVALASSCGCSSAPLTTYAMETARRQAAPWQAMNSRVRDAERALDAVLIEFSYRFNQDYEAMPPEQKKAHYATMVVMSAKRAMAVDAVADAYKAAGAPAVVQDVLRAHAATLRQGPAARVALLRQAEAMLADPAVHRDAVARQAAAFFDQACERVAEGRTAACIAKAVANSQADDPQHFAAFATMAGPAAMLAGRLAQLKGGLTVLTN